jgi:hypothetical protein
MLDLMKDADNAAAPLPIQMVTEGPVGHAQPRAIKVGSREANGVKVVPVAHERNDRR